MPEDNTPVHLDMNQLRHIVAAILAAGAAGGQEGGVSPETVYAYLSVRAKKPTKLIQRRRCKLRSYSRRRVFFGAAALD